MKWKLLALIVYLHSTVTVGMVQVHKKRASPPPGRGVTVVTTGAKAVAVAGQHLATKLAPTRVICQGLALKHGPIMTLWLGSMNAVVISSHEVAQDMFKNHDVVLAGRKTYEAMKGEYGTEGSLIPAQYGVVLSMALGSILLAFDWNLEDGVEPSEMDMSERMGTTLKKATPLKAVAIPRKG
ncbi:hypothetical protein Vadar_011639 [Vaccinium darrowii]|uniref:Uncharacterized protein n=1 Tax=Vaccinium darrowii TaxID=229202 RepID=A0ACB7XZN2_9ERIC|nr:hypothetical protein Vadar_011639 [Vaccinium darrowii]